MIGRRKGRTIDATATLASRPMRAVEAKLEPAEKGGGRLVVALKARRWAGLFTLPAGGTRTFELDEIGVYVWNQLDGRTSVEQLLRSVGKKYNLDLRQAEASTIAFLNMLIKRGLVGLTKEPAADARG